MSLENASLYLVSQAHTAAGPLEDLVPDLAAAGVDIIQLREKEMSSADIQRFARPLLELCHAAGVVFIVNDDAGIAAQVGADGVHVGQEDIPVPAARRVTGGIVGLSTHSRQQIIAAEPLSPDYIAVGPVFDTPTKPGRPSVGLDLLTFAAEHSAIPWFAIGGIDSNNIDQVVAAGARRIAVVRAITEAADPPAAAAALKAALPG